MEDALLSTVVDAESRCSDLRSTVTATPAHVPPAELIYLIRARNEHACKISVESDESVAVWVRIGGVDAPASIAALVRTVTVSSNIAREDVAVETISSVATGLGTTCCCQWLSSVDVPVCYTTLEFAGSDYWPEHEAR